MKVWEFISVPIIHPLTIPSTLLYFRNTSSSLMEAKTRFQSLRMNPFGKKREFRFSLKKRLITSTTSIFTAAVSTSLGMIGLSSVRQMVIIGSGIENISRQNSSSSCCPAINLDLSLVAPYVPIWDLASCEDLNP